MVNKLAIETNHFKAIAPIVSQLIESLPLLESTNPVSLFQVNGAADTSIPIDGGPQFGHMFLDAFERAVEDHRTPQSFRTFVSPWFFLESSEDYKTLFEEEGFEVESAEILMVTSRKTPDQVMDSFESCAALAYCNPDCYQDSITQEEFDDFRNIVRKNFNDMADDSGAMELLFNRIELVAKKP